MTMIERVARAICKSRHDAFNDWHSLDGDERWQFFSEARAAIEAMREPTDAMVRANGTCPSEDGQRWLDEDARTTWQAMIDAALKEQP